MTHEDTAFQDLEKRLAKVESQNRYMKRVGLTVLLLGSLVLVMGQARPGGAAASPRFETVTARHIIVEDDQGRKRIELETTPLTDPVMLLYWRDGKSAASLNAYESLGGSSLNLTDETATFVASLAAGTDKSIVGLGRANLTTNGGRASLETTAEGETLLLSGPNFRYDQPMAAQFGVATTQGGPQLMLRDPNGFYSQLGVANLDIPSTGETRKTSAASILLFDKTNHLIWRAP